MTGIEVGMHLILRNPGRTVYSNDIISLLT